MKIDELITLYNRYCDELKYYEDMIHVNDPEMILNLISQPHPCKFSLYSSYDSYIIVDSDRNIKSYKPSEIIEIIEADKDFKEWRKLKNN